MRKFMNVCLLMALTTSLLFTSCGDDDKEESKTNNGTKVLVGSWINQYEYGYDTYDFYEDGSGMATENAYSGGHASWTFDYTYDEQTQQLRMQDKNDKNDITIVTIVLGKDNSSFVLIDSDGDSWKFIRQEHSEK